MSIMITGKPGDHVAHAHDAQAVIHALYATLNDPANVAEILNRLIALADGQQALGDATRDEILKHFERVIGLAQTANDQAVAKVQESLQCHALLLDIDGRVVNPVGRRLEELAEMIGCRIATGEFFLPDNPRSFFAALKRVRDDGDRKAVFCLRGESGDGGYDGFCVDLAGANFGKDTSIANSQAKFAVVLMARVADGVARADAEQTQIVRLVRPQPDIVKDVGYWTQHTPSRKWVLLPDGRKLAFREYGVAHGPVVLGLNTIVTASIADPYLANSAETVGARFIMIERPGLGASDPSPQHDHQSVADDLADFVGLMDLRQVAIYSSGAATSFALALAKRLGHQAVRIGLFAPRLGKPSRKATGTCGKTIWSMHLHPWTVSAAVNFAYALRTRAVVFHLINNSSIVNAMDERIVRGEKMNEFMTTQVMDMLHANVQGFVDELKLATSDQFVDPYPVRLPISIWHGMENTSLHPEDMLEKFGELPNTTIKLLPGIGIHYTQDIANQMMGWLVSGLSQK